MSRDELASVGSISTFAASVGTPSTSAAPSHSHPPRSTRLSLEVEQALKSLAEFGRSSFSAVATDTDTKSVHLASNPQLAGSEGSGQSAQEDHSIPKDELQHVAGVSSGPEVCSSTTPLPVYDFVE
jgi:hypothetical protein